MNKIELTNRIKDNVKDEDKRVIIPDGEEIRVIQSLKYTPDVTKVILGNEQKIIKLIEKTYPIKYKKILKKVEIIDPEKFITDEIVNDFVKNCTKYNFEEGKKILQSNPNLAAYLLRKNYADALVGGTFYTSAELLRASLKIIKPKKDTKRISSSFLLQKNERFLLFADCAVNINPDAETIKEITLQTLNTAYDLGIEPKVALLTYSTKGSGSGEDVLKMREAYELLIKEKPELKDIIDGELQFDAAISPEVAKIKSPDSLVAGKANVFIFPNLSAGNIGYKLVQYLGDWEAYGPLIQGLNMPVNDLSRGATPTQIAQSIYLALR